MRKRFDKKLHQLQKEIMTMGRKVEKQLQASLKALKNLDAELAQKVIAGDEAINARRNSIEAKCFELIVTQQPAAGDLRAIMAVINMIVDLERMGDQAKNVAKIVSNLADHPTWAEVEGIQHIGQLVISMLNQSLLAYEQSDVRLAEFVLAQDKEVDAIFDQVLNQVMEMMAQTTQQDKVEAEYDILRAARELERFGDLATNIAERVIYISTGEVST
jgi:phosphate transport system protein